MDRIIYRRAYSSYIIMYRELQGRGEYLLLLLYMHACMIPICLGASYQVHSYLFSFFMRESFSQFLFNLPNIARPDLDLLYILY